MRRPFTIRSLVEREHVRSSCSNLPVLPTFACVSLMAESPYSLLGVREDATLEEVKRAYTREARRFLFRLRLL